MASRCLVWRFQRAGSRYALALAEDKLYGRAAWAPGYESHKLLDILSAIWYLESGFKGDLPEHTLRVLDRIKESAAAELPDFEIYGISKKEKGGSCGIKKKHSQVNPHQ